MAFGMENLKDKIKQIEIPVDLNIESLHNYVKHNKEDYDLSCLIVNKEKLKSMNLNTIEEFEAAKMKATTNNLKVINVIRYSAPIIKLVCEKEREDEKRGILFVKINERLNEYAKKIMTLWNISTEDKSNNWIVNVLVRTLANGFTEDMFYNDENIEKLAMSIYEMSELNIETKYEFSAFAKLTTSIKLSIIKAATPISIIINKYPFLKNKDLINEEIRKSMEFLVNKSNKSVGDLSEETLDEKDRVMLFKVILEESAKIFCDQWEKNGILFNEKYKNYTKEQMNILENSNPNGIQIFEYVSRKFNEQYDNIVNLAKL